RPGRAVSPATWLSQAASTGSAASGSTSGVPSGPNGCVHPVRTGTPRRCLMRAGKKPRSGFGCDPTKPAPRPSPNTAAAASAKAGAEKTLGWSARAASARHSGTRALHASTGRHSVRIGAIAWDVNVGSTFMNVCRSPLLFRTAPDQDMQSKSVLGDEEQENRLGDHGGRRRNRRAKRTIFRNEQHAQAEIGGECGRIDERAGTLLAEHVEK